ncbi:MAG: hypothetical protein ABI895_02085 [Deltaproteobacteria bacterium]
MSARPHAPPPLASFTRSRRLSPRWQGLATWAALALAGATVHAADADSLAPRGRDSQRARSSPFWLRLRAGVARSSEPRERLFGVLELGVALDVLAAGRASALGAAAGESDSSSVPQDEAARTEGRGQLPSPAPTRGPAPPRLALTSALARATLAAASRVWDAAAAPRALDSMLSRTHSSATLPEVRLAAGTSRDQSLRLTPTLTDPAKFTQDGGQDLWFEARLTWHLEHVLFSHDEIAIERLKAQALESRRLLVRQVLEALLGWQRARQAQGSETLAEEERRAAELRELDAVLRLDAWTDGWFSRHLERTRGADAPARLDPSLD